MLHLSLKSGIYLLIMNTDIIIGCVLTIVALVSVAALAIWSRGTIERIARTGYRTARQTLKDRNGAK
jgi:hypothetical protein